MTCIIFSHDGEYNNCIVLDIYEGRWQTLGWSFKQDVYVHRQGSTRINLYNLHENDNTNDLYKPRSYKT